MQDFTHSQKLLNSVHKTIHKKPNFFDIYRHCYNSGGLIQLHEPATQLL